MSKKKIPKRAIKRYGFIVDSMSSRESPLMFLLVNFLHGRGIWKCYNIQSYDEARYYHSLFVLSSMLQEQHYSIIEKTEKRFFPVYGDDTRNTTNPQYRYDQMVRSYWDVRNKIKKDGKPEAYGEISLELRYGFGDIFKVIADSKTRYKARIEIGHHANPENIYFWQLKDFDSEISKQFLTGKVRLLEDSIPDSSINQTDVIKLREQICSSIPWKKWHEDKDTKIKADAKSATWKRVREYLQEDALSALEKQLHSDNLNKYISLQLEKFINPIYRRNDDTSVWGDIWHPMGLTELLFPGKKYFLSAVSGAGKTTFLRHFQYDLLKGRDIPKFASLKNDDFLPIYLEAKILDMWAFSGPKDFIDCLSKHIRRKKSDSPLKHCIEKAYQQERIIFLIDAMDNLDILGKNCSELIDNIVTVAGNNPIVMTARPSSSEYVKHNEGITPLRLNKVTSVACKHYLGRYHHKVLGICKDDKSLLAIPMFLYMVKKLVQTGDDRKIRSRWDLYSRYVEYILNEHPPNRKMIDHKQWQLNILKSVSMIAFQAIDREYPAWEKISSDILGEVSDTIPISIDTISSSGLAEIMQIENDFCLIFQHRSFQEYFAARWIGASKERKQHVSNEYWNPKWREVINFLGGHNCKDIVKGIYPKGCKDNSIHSRLFLAAECIADTSVRSDTKARIVDDLLFLHESYYFRIEAFIRLIKIGGNLAHEAAWKIACKTFVVAGEDILGLDLNDLKPLYSKQRLDWVLDRLLNQQLFSCFYVKLLAAWADRIPDSTIAKIINNWIYGKQECTLVAEIMLKHRCHVEFLSQLTAQQLQPIIQIFFSNEIDTWTVSMMLNVSFASHKVNLSKDQMSTIIDSLDDPLKFVHLATILNHLPDALTDEYVDIIVDKWWGHNTHGNYGRHLFTKHMPRICRRLPSEKIDDIIKGLEDTDEKVSFYAAMALTYCIDRLTENQIQSILAYVNNKGMHSDHINIILQILPHVNEELALKVLENICNPEEHIRIASMNSVYILKEHVRLEHIRQIEENLKKTTKTISNAKSLNIAFMNMTERHAALFAITSVLDRIPDETFRYILDTLETRDFCVPLPREIFINLAKRIDEDQAAIFVEKLNQEKNVFCIESLCLLLEPERLSSNSIAQLCRILKYNDLGDSGFRVVELLKKIHAIGKMEGM